MVKGVCGGCPDHLDRYGSKHSDAIITRNQEIASRFFREVDSRDSVLECFDKIHADGAEFGFGAEIGISTDKIHARGPMGLDELTSYKYLIEGTGQILALVLTGEGPNLRMRPNWIPSSP